MAIDLFQSLKDLGQKRNHMWYDNLSAADKKTAHPFVIARWLTGTADPQQILNINDNVNPYLFSLGSEKALLFKLLATSSTGYTSRYQWIKAPGGATSITNRLKVIADYYEIGMREAKSYSQSISDDDIMLMADELGWAKEDIGALKKELTNGSRAAASTSTTTKKSK